MATLVNGGNAPNMDGEIVAIDPELKAIFGEPPLSHGESEEEYDCLWRQFRSHIRPASVTEECLVRNLVDLSWEIRRFRRTQAGLMDVGSADALPRVVARFVPDVEQRRELVNGWVAGDPSAKEKVAKLLAPSSLGNNAIEAEAFSGRLATFDRLDQILTRMEIRRNSVLKEIDRHREVLGRRAREAIADVIDIAPEPPRIEGTT
jgi:hypothetical protein